MAKSTLVLKGHEAAVLMASKGEFDNVDASRLDCLKAAFAVLSGLRSSGDVRTGDVLRIVSQVHDKLTEAAILRRPMQSMLDVLQRDLMFLNKNDREPSAADFFLNGMMSSIACMSIRSEDGDRVLYWRVKENFSSLVHQMHFLSLQPHTVVQAN